MEHEGNDKEIREGDLTWLDPKYVPLTSIQGDLFVAFKYGWPLVIAYWRTGNGWRTLCGNTSIDPDLVAHINLPD